MSTLASANTAPEMWPPHEGLEKFTSFEKHRNCTIRALQEAIRKLLENLFTASSDSPKILEVGSGAGFFARNVSKRFQKNWTELEPQQAFLEEARIRRPAGNFIQGSAYKLPFDDGTFDAVCGYSSFDVLGDLPQALREAHRVLRSGGYFFHVLDLEPDTSIIQKDFQERRIPSVVSRWSDPQHALQGVFGEHVGQPFRFGYMSGRNLDKFLDTIGMTEKEVEAQGPNLSAGFGMDRYYEKVGREDPLGYMELFERHTSELDEVAYFQEKLRREVASIFGRHQTEKRNIHGTYKGPERSPLQKELFPDAFFFSRYGGELKVYRTKILRLIQNSPFPRLADWLQPSCVESVTLHAVTARKVI